MTAKPYFGQMQGQLVGNPDIKPAPHALIQGSPQEDFPDRRAGKEGEDHRAAAA